MDVKNYDKIALYNTDNENHTAVYQLKRDYQQKNILSKIQEKLNSTEKISILEFGPGMGCLIDLIFSKTTNVDYHIVDIDSDALGKLKKTFPQISTHVVLNKNDLSALNHSFDLIIAIDVWEHIPTEQVVDYTRWCDTHLKKDGQLILQVPNWGCPLTPFTFYSDLTHCNRFNEHSIMQLFKMADISTNGVYLYPRLTPGKIGAFRDALAKIFYLLFRSLFYLCGSVRIKICTPDLIAVVKRN